MGKRAEQDVMPFKEDKEIRWAAPLHSIDLIRIGPSCSFPFVSIGFDACVLAIEAGTKRTQDRDTMGRDRIPIFEYCPYM
jgi:hypothetical protein